MPQKKVSKLVTKSQPKAQKAQPHPKPLLNVVGTAVYRSLFAVFVSPFKAFYEAVKTAWKVMVEDIKNIVNQ